MPTVSYGHTIKRISVFWNLSCNVSGWVPWLPNELWPLPLASIPVVVIHDTFSFTYFWMRRGNRFPSSLYLQQIVQYLAHRKYSIFHCINWCISDQMTCPKSHWNQTWGVWNKAICGQAPDGRYAEETGRSTDFSQWPGGSFSMTELAVFLFSGLGSAWLELCLPRMCLLKFQWLPSHPSYTSDPFFFHPTLSHLMEGDYKQEELHFMFLIQCFWRIDSWG